MLSMRAALRANRHKYLPKLELYLVGDLHGMQGVRGLSPLGLIKVFASYKISLVNNYVSDNN
tara:strand:- start:205 stop:390 length:186 start_codon:yes stop_codon:yes gene_type:complete